MTLADIARKANWRLMKMVDLTWNMKRRDEAMAIMKDYCEEVKAHFGIELKPHVDLHERRLEIVVDAVPVSDYDKMMIQALQAKESGLLRKLGMEVP